MKRFLTIVFIISSHFLIAQTALDFDGTNDYANVPTITAPSTFTFEAWVNIDANLPGYRTIVDFTSDAPYFGILNGNLVLYLNGFGVTITHASTFPLSTWTHVAVVCTSGYQELFVNGVSVGTSAVLWNAPSSGMGIGWNGSDSPIDGRIDDLRIWNVIRTPAEINSNMTTCFTGAEAGLLALYKFEDGTGSSILTDATGNGYTGTLTNMDPATDWVAGNINCNTIGARLVLNGAYLKITNNGKIVVENGNANAIVRNSGHIISESANNELKWVIGNQTGTYTVPFGYSNSDYTPVEFTKTAGTGAGVFNFATYRTSSWQNSTNLPAAVTNVNDADGNDNSAFVIDRFWKIDANGYTAKPDLTNLTFTYIDSEHSVASNTIVESTLFAQRYNTTTSDWGDFLPTVTLNTTNNTVIIPSVSSANFFNWWTLVSTDSPLPVTLISFKGKCEDNVTVINWTTSLETDNDYFTVEKSEDALSWSAIETVKSKGNSADKNNYSLKTNSNGLSYYRLKMVDIKNNATYSNVISTQCGTDEPEIVVYPNPNLGVFVLKNGKIDTEIAVLNSLGQELRSIRIESAMQVINLDLPAGMYVLVPKTEESNSKTIRLVIEK